MYERSIWRYLQLIKGNDMSNAELLKVIEESITEEEVKRMVESYKRLIKQAIISGQTYNAEKWTETLNTILNRSIPSDK